MQNSELTIGISAKIKSNKYDAVALAGCAIIAAAVCVAQISGSTILIALCLLAFLLFHIWSCIRDMSLSVLLFFLPWSPLLKLYKGGISFFTIALLLSCAIYFVKNRFSFDTYQIIIPALIAALTLVAKAIGNNSIDKSYMFFLIMLVLFPCVIKNNKGVFDFWNLTLFFALGIISAALSAQQVAGYQNISQYIKVDSYLRITRLSGYYGDPNFYSAHITACLAGVQLILMRERNRLRQVMLLIISLALLYCGLLSASKSFVVVAACLVLVWIPILLEKSNRSNRFRLIMGIICAVLIMLSSSAFQELLRILDDRFSYAANISQLTTGRTEIWLRYFNEFSHNALLTLFGEGFSAVNLYGRASHNSVIQGIYQFGIIGFPLLCLWMYFMLKSIFVDLKSMKGLWGSALLMCIGVVLPWMALDILFFDELFLLPVYAAAGVLYMQSNSNARLTLQNKNA
ncbi:MAG: hypothetical protein SPJ77_04830 [Eubacteriales bacterium]|nr:hypothetical protein [Clostridiales bacterium]MDD7594198.1 hypothetical protein [Clostridiales bacterium]MDY5860289.1 hypothetical protein [Eubacteriales bacterium]